MRKAILLTIAMLSFVTTTLLAQSFETATQAVTNMGVGWNLGNTLDANAGNTHQDLTSETYWGQPYTKPELMVMIKNAGFGAMRIPVTWMNHMDSNGKVDAAWMARVHEVVDYVINAGMYCILNVHHDTGDGNEHWLHASTAVYNSTKTKYEYLWKQIAEEFKDYDQHLLFEGYNEMLDKYNSWCYATYNTSNRYIATDAADAYTAINNYAQSFVTTVRNTGGNNAKRNLIVNTYAASCGAGNWNSHLKDPLKELKYPNDPAGAGHIAFQIHTYPNVSNLTNAKSEVDDIMSAAKTHLVTKGGPVIIGEWGTANNNENDYMVRRNNVLQFADYMVKKAKENNFATFYWMGISDGTDRSLPVFTQPDMAETIVKAYHGSSFQPVIPTRDDLGESVYEVTYDSQWAELNLVGEAITTSSFLRLELELADTPAAGALQYKWYDKQDVQSITTASSQLVFNSSTMGSTIRRITLQSKILPNKIVVKKVYLVKKDGTKVEMKVTSFWGCTVEEKFITSIGAVEYKPLIDNVIYDLSGRRIAIEQYSTPDTQRSTNLPRGIYIYNGRKVVIK